MSWISRESKRGTIPTERGKSFDFPSRGRPSRAWSFLADAQLPDPGAGIWSGATWEKLRQVVTNLVSNAIKYGLPQHASVVAMVGINRNGHAA